MIFVNASFFLPGYVFPATKLAQQNSPGLRFTSPPEQWKKNCCRTFFISYLQVKLCHGIETFTVLEMNMLAILTILSFGGTSCKNL